MPALDTSIAITGMGAVTALGHGVAALLSGLEQGARPFGPVTRFDVTGCRANWAADCGPLVDELPTRTVALGLIALREALAQAGAPEDRRRWGLVMGSAAAGTPALEAALAQPGVTTPITGFAKYPMLEYLATRERLGGPRAMVNTACSSGAVSMAIAMDWLRLGLADAVVAGGADELTRYTYTGFASLRAVDEQGCRPFDRARRGMTVGEGAGCLVLERLDDARRRGAQLLGLLAGTAMACDAHHLTAPDPEGAGAVRAITSAMRMAGVSAEQIGFVNAHGTGTPLNDAAEVTALVAALGAAAPRTLVHSVKASTGHCMGAAGALEAIVTLESLRRGRVPATAALEDVEFAGLLDFVQGEPRSTTARFALSTSFGFGGNDACLLLAHPEVA